MIYQDKVYLQQVWDVLSPAGYEVLTAASLAEAVSHLEQMNPRIVVISPTVSAELRDEVTDAVRRLRPGITVLVLSPNHMDKISDLLQ